MMAPTNRSGELRAVVIGAGIGGLTTAALLAKAGLDVTVLEAHVYAGGCAGTFFHKGYRFDAGATLAGGFYPGGPMDRVAQAAGIEGWPAHHSDPAMSVILPDGTEIPRWGDPTLRRETYGRAFGPQGDAFWAWQERTADLLWDLALQSPPWPPQSPQDLLRLGRTGAGWLLTHAGQLRPGLVHDAFRPMAARLPSAPDALRQFVDAQLLIAAQTTSGRANALYGASALDLPRRGIVHLARGMGAIAETLVAAVRRHGGQVHFRQTATRIERRNGRPVAVETRRGERFDADLVVVNLPPWNIVKLFDDEGPARLQELPAIPADAWGAFMVYAGVDEAALGDDGILHKQVVVQEPLGEGNSVFVSISPPWDASRAPDGARAVTISTHTSMNSWWQLFHQDRARYEARKEAYAQRLLDAAERAVPGLQRHARLTMPGTPVTFQRFTLRERGWVGGFPQTNLFRTWGPRLSPNLWMVGDSIFPGQSTAAVALGGMRVAHAILRPLGRAIAETEMDAEEQDSRGRLEPHMKESP